MNTTLRDTPLSPCSSIRSLNQLYGMPIGATDGPVGEVADFYFDDQSWVIRYLIADTGTWLSGRQVLLSPHAFERNLFNRPMTDTQFLRVCLTREQIEKSPSIDLRRPVSRQDEERFYSYYDWPIYWQGGSVWGAVGYPGAVPTLMPMPQKSRPPTPLPKDHHLRSAKEVKGYKIHATDGELGKVSGFIMDGESWLIREVAVEAGHWYSGKEIYILPANISRISYPESAVYVNLSLEDIRQTAENNVVERHS